MELIKPKYTYTRKSEYTGLTQREKKNAYVRKYWEEVSCNTSTQ